MPETLVVINTTASRAKVFSPNELSVQQAIHFDQSVTSDITEMAELSQQQKSHEEPDDTQSLLYTKPFIYPTPSF